MKIRTALLPFLSLAAIFPFSAQGALVSYYLFEGNGSSATGIGNGSVGASVSFAVGVDGDAMVVDVSAVAPANVISVPLAQAFDPGSGDFSIAFWVKRSQADTSNADGIFDALDGTGTGFQANFRGGGDLNKMGIRLDDDSENFVLVVDPIPVADTVDWHHFAMVIDRAADVARLYRDGELAISVDISSLTGSLSPTQDLFIGGLNNGSGNGLDGALDELRFYDHALELSEVEALATGEGGGGELSSAVAISPQQAVFSDSISVSITSNGGGEIRYTVNGADPNIGSDLYTGPLTLTEFSEVRARVFEDDKLPGPVSAEVFYKAPSAPPNIVLIACDGLGYSDLACFGNTVIATPNIDSVASGGMKFTQANNVSTFGSGARYGLLTGRFPVRSGFPIDLDGDAALGLHPREWTIAEGLLKEGYATALFGTWSLGSAETRFLPIRQGFEIFNGLPYAHGDTSQPPLMEGEAVIQDPADISMLTASHTQRAVDFLNQNQDRPHFLFVPMALPKYPLPVGDGESLRGGYGDAVEAIDDAVGELVEAAAPNTLFIFTGLHGAEIEYGIEGGSPGLFRGGFPDSWEGGLRVPLLARWPGVIPPGLTCQAPVSSMDLYPTLLGVAGARQPEDRAIDGPPLLWRDRMAKSTHLLHLREFGCRSRSPGGI